MANKSDLPVHADFHYDSLEARVIFDWENGYVECSAKEKININKIFKELLNQSKPRYGVTIPASTGNGSHRLQRLLSNSQKAAKKTRQIETSPNNLKRRQSLPITPQNMNSSNSSCANVPNVIEEEECAAAKLAANSNLQNSEKPKSEKRRSSFPAALRRNSCKVS